MPREVKRQDPDDDLSALRILTMKKIIIDTTLEDQYDCASSLTSIFGVIYQASKVSNEILPTK
jgi:hypothetical protein